MEVNVTCRNSLCRTACTHTTCFFHRTRCNNDISFSALL